MWLNPGVMGMPANDGNTAVWYMILDDQKEYLPSNTKNLQYDYKVTSALMLEIVQKIC
jgi:hypothetical protein